MFLLGYDIGSSSIKVALQNAADRSVVSVVQYPEDEMDMISRQRGWAEQQPELWWQHLCRATKKIISETGVNANKIKGIGISYQMHGLVLVDEEQRVLRPSIIWCDSRAASIGREAFREIGEEFCLKNFLNSPGNFTASKLKWVKDNEPDIYERIHKILLPGDFIAMKLTGEIRTTIAGLSEAVLWNFKEKKLAKRVLNYFEIEEHLLPKVTPTFSIQGQVTRKAAEETGLVSGIPVTYRAGDQPNNALSLNVLNKGEVAATSGTSGVVYGIVDRPLFDEKSRVNAFAHVNYEENFDKIGILLCINGAGIQYSWMKHQIARSGRTYQDMERMISSVPVGSEGICILPFGNGSERIFEDKNLESHIHNIEFNRHTRAHLYRASLEGVAFSFVYGVNLLKEMGLVVDVIRVGNDNMFQSKVFSMTIATLLGCRIEVVETTGAIGAARAAGVASGVYRNIEEAMEDVRPAKVYEPRLNFAMCTQAYNYWLSILKRILNEAKESQSVIDRLREQNEELKRALHEKNKRITSQSIEIDAQKDLMKSLNESVNLLRKTTNKPEIQEELQKVRRSIRSIQKNKTERHVFEEHFDLLNDDFIKRLKEKFPDLVYDELKMCALLKLELSTKEIATRLNLSNRGAETKRYRLRKKLGIEKKGSFIQFFQKI